MNTGEKVTYWMFYMDDVKLREKYLLDVNNEIEQRLYAYTDKKKYARQFMEERNMDMFRVVKKKIDKERINFLASEYGRNYLVVLEGLTHSADGKSYQSYSLIVTEYEHNMVMVRANFLFYNRLKSFVDLGLLQVLKPKYAILLGSVGYWQLVDPDLNVYDSDGVNITFENFQYDLLYVFLDLFGELLEGI